MKSLKKQVQTNCRRIFQIHEKISSYTAHLLGPLVFNTGIKEESWNLSTAELLYFPEGSVGKALGEFLRKNRLEPIARAESHDLYHVLFDYSTSLKDEVALQFFLRGNGKTSIASFGTSFGAWLIFPRQWSYFRSSFNRGKTCRDISTLNLKSTLKENFEQIKTSLIEQIKK